VAGPLIPERVPLFPLPNAVLFPGMPLPLQVFEPRYRRMVGDALEGERFIGMTLLRPGWEADYEGRPPVYPCGCAGRIEQCEPLPDGRYALVLRGVSRFQIEAEHAGREYRIASVRRLADGVGDASGLAAARRKVLETVGQAADGPALLGLRDDIPHDVFVNALCQSMSLSPVEQQSLLECDSVLERCRRLIEILEFKQLESGSPGGGGIH
jgi:Lon protease-like protein